MSIIASRTFLSLAIFVAATGFVMPQQAKADTFLLNGWDGPSRFNSYVFNVSIDKSVYTPGATIIATTQFTSWACSNGVFDISGSFNYATVNATINAVTQAILNKYASSGSKNFTAPSISGNYFAVFTASAFGNDLKTLITNGPSSNTPIVATISIPYTVSAVTGGTTTGGTTTGGTTTGGTTTGGTTTGGTITGGTITGGTVTGGTITGGTITGGTVTGGTTTGGTITGGTITGGTVTGGTVTGGTITGGTVTGGTITGAIPTPTPPTVSISVTPNRVVAGNNTTVSWVASNVTSCSVTKNGAPWKTVASDATKTQSKSFIETITAQTAYVITCTNGSIQNVASAIVNITSVFQGF